MTSSSDTVSQLSVGDELVSRRAQATLLQVRDLTVRLEASTGGFVHAIEGVSLDVAAGEAVGILGESGCGKTTVALALLRLLPRDGQIVRGSVEFAGCDLVAADESELEKIRGAGISLIFQEPGIALNPVMRVGDQVSEVIYAHRKWNWKRCREEAAAAVAEVFPRDAARISRTYPHELSGGQRQRVLIAQAIACGPALVIADEPTAALDTTTQAEILALIKQLKQRLRVALVLITHNPALLVGLADRILVMYAGRVVEEGPLEQVYHEPLHPYTRGLLRSVPEPGSAGAAGPKTPLPTIPGSPPDLARLPAGCHFEPRCADRMAVCTTREPGEVRPEVARRVRCFKYGG
ncbi:MAG: ABC transporter ATP-binding protein [Candidatus Acidiferrales bacterium]